jgi:hypothetical protein
VIKPFDVGNGLVAASVGERGALLSVGRAHPRIGYVEFVAGPRFPERDRHSPAAVRRHRARLAQGIDPVVALAVDPVDNPPASSPALLRGTPASSVALLDGVLPTSDTTGPGWRHDSITWPVIGCPTMRQRHRIHAWAGGLWRIVVRLRGRLDRPPLGEITERGPLPPTGAVTGWVITAARSTAVATAPTLPAAAAVTVTTEYPLTWAETDGGADAVLEWTAGPGDVLTVLVTLDLDDVAGGQRASSSSTPGSDDLVDDLAATRRHCRHLVSPRRWPATGHEPLTVPADRRPAMVRLTHRALHYLLGCAATRVAVGETCIVADHRLLPLSWTRDAYWGALLLLANGSPTGINVVEQHLRWLFRHCERPGGRWCRSHLPNGAPKDRAYQADQQLYPLLELCDFHRTTGRLPTLADRRLDWGALVRRAWTALRPVDGLLASDETPADDADLPYLVSTHILWWWTGTRLAGLHPQAADDVAGLPERIAERFATDGPFGPQWAYAIDGHRRAHLYQDANDIPTALAPRWGLCPADDPVWRATMAYAWSADNPGFVPGTRGGLGSRHTPGSTWPLGDLQEWVVASLAGDQRRVAQVLDRLIGAATPDGLLPEAYDPADQRVTARHWFAWPAAALGALYLCGGTLADKHNDALGRPLRT